MQRLNESDYNALEYLAEPHCARDLAAHQAISEVRARERLNKLWRFSAIAEHGRSVTERSGRAVFYRRTERGFELLMEHRIAGSATVSAGN
jgi:hypothetical protein